MRYQKSFGRKEGINHRKANIKWVGKAQIRFKFEPEASNTEIKHRKLNKNPAMPNEKKTRKSSVIILFFLRYSIKVSIETSIKMKFTTIVGEVRLNPDWIGFAS